MGCPPYALHPCARPTLSSRAVYAGQEILVRVWPRRNSEELGTTLRKQQLKAFLKERWRNFAYPYGWKRTFSPAKWEFSAKILILGEILAVAAAIASVWISEWPMIAAAIIGSSTLLWYALDLVSKGEAPLTNRSAHTIRQVISAVEMEKQGAAFDWENIDRRGGILSDMTNWTHLRPDLKEIMDKHGVPLVVAAQMLRDE